MIIMPLTKGFEAIVCDCHYDLVKDYKWSAMINRDNDYVKVVRATMQVANGRLPSGRPKTKMFLMSREILGAKKGELAEHEDGNPLNNQCSNLRIADTSGNMANSRRRSDNKSGHKGIYWHKASKKWEVIVQYKGVRVYRERFDDINEAIKMRELKAREIHKEFYRNE